MQFRTIVRSLKKNNVRLVPGGVYLSYDRRACLVGAVAVTAFGYDKAYEIICSGRVWSGDRYGNSARSNVSVATGIECDKLCAAEWGFEGRSPEGWMTGKYTRYYNLGKKLRAVALNN